MFTRCPKCKEVHPLTAAVLTRSTGLVQCGRCSRIFNALSFLSDDWHASQTFKPEESSDGALPVLGGRSKRRVRKLAASPTADSTADSSKEAVTASSSEAATAANAIETDPVDEVTDTELPAEESQAGLPRGWLWGLATLGLLLITVANVSWTYRDHWLKQPVVHQWLLDTGRVEAEKPKGAFKSPTEIQLVSRDMHTHPTRTGILVLSVTFVNLAQQTQAFPVLRITLLDGGNQPIAQRRLQPEAYLRAGADLNTGLAPDVFLPVLLELADPGEQAVGFEIEFL